MKRIRTPVLKRIKIGKHPVPSGELWSEDRWIGICLDELEKLWHVPKSAERFWLQTVPGPEADSVKVKVKTHGFDLAWSLLENPGPISQPTNYFRAGRGLRTLLIRAGLVPIEWTALNVRLLYE